MTRTRANSGQAAKRPVAATPGASLPLDASLLSIVANLEGLDLNGLRRQWRTHLGGACRPPPSSSTPRRGPQRVRTWAGEVEALGQRAEYLVGPGDLGLIELLIAGRPVGQWRRKPFLLKEGLLAGWTN
jgi:hypothetical protein